MFQNSFQNEKLIDIESNQAQTNKVSSNSIHNNHNNNVKNDISNLKSGVSLDPSALAKQNMPTTQKKYANINTGESITGNGVLHNGPYSNQNNFMNKNKNILNESEITC